MQTHPSAGVLVVRLTGDRVLTWKTSRHVEADVGQRIGDNIRRLLRPTPTA